MYICKQLNNFNDTLNQIEKAKYTSDPIAKAPQIIKFLKVLIAWFSEDSQNRILSSHKFTEYSSILDYFSSKEGKLYYLEFHNLCLELKIAAFKIKPILHDHYNEAMMLTRLLNIFTALSLQYLQCLPMQTTQSLK
jgi:hypothetical protein